MSVTGQRLKQQRKLIGISADEVANELGVSRSTIFRYENGYIEKVPANVIEELAGILKTTPAYLMGWTDDPHDLKQAGDDGNNEEFDQNYVCRVSDKNNNYMTLGSSPTSVKKIITHRTIVDLRNDEDQLLNCYNRLNDSGRAEAIKRIDELAMIPSYTTQNSKLSDINYLEPVAAHRRTDISADDNTDEMKQQEMDIMDDPDF